MKLIAVTLSVALAATVCPTRALASTPRKPNSCQVTVPDTYGLDESSARAVLTLRGLETYVWMNKEAQDWTVVYSQPVPGTPVNRCVDPLVEIWIGN